MAIPAILFARRASVAVPVTVLALPPPAGRERDIVLGITYVVVIFSILTQGLALERVARRLVKRRKLPPVQAA